MPAPTAFIGQKSIRQAARDMIYAKAQKLLEHHRELDEEDLRNFRAYADGILSNASKLLGAMKPITPLIEKGTHAPIDPRGDTK